MSRLPTVPRLRRPLLLLLSAALLLCAPGDSRAAERNKEKDGSKKKTDGPVSVDRGVARSGTKHGATLQYRNFGRTTLQTQDWPFDWDVDTSRPITRIEVRLGEQRVYVFQGEEIAATSPISSGCPGRETRSGHFKVLAKELEHYSNLYGNFVDSRGRIVNASAEAGDPIPRGLRYEPSPMPYYLRITEDGIGMHAGFLPGYAASHGCIRLPRKFAPRLYEVVAVGTPVKVIAADGSIACNEKKP